MFTINKCSLGWVVILNDADGKPLERKVFETKEYALSYLGRMMDWMEN